MQLKWLRVLLPKLENLIGKRSFVHSTTDVSVKCSFGRKQTARKTMAIKSYFSSKKQQSKENMRTNKEKIEICDHVGECGKEINEMLVVCVKCKDIQQFGFTELQEHCQQNHPEDKPIFVCSRCGFTVDDVEQMNVHAFSHTMDQALNTELGANKEGLALIREMELHKTRHLKPDTLYCNKCRFSTKDPLLFQKHILRHEEIQYKCGRCDRVCYTRGEFQRHSVQHTGTFPFKCRYCDYGAVRKDYVVKHTKGVHRDIIKNGGTALVLPMRKGCKKKTSSKAKTISKVKPTITAQNENSTNVRTHDKMVNSVALISNPCSTYQMQGESVEEHQYPNVNSVNENKSVDKFFVQNIKHLNCPPTDARKNQLQVLAPSKHALQPGTPLTLIAPAQMVIPSNCLAQLIEIKTVNGKQQLVFKLIPQVSVAGVTGMSTFPVQEIQHVNSEMAQPQKNSVSNNSTTLLTEIVDYSELPFVDSFNEVEADDNIEMNTKLLFSNPQSSFSEKPTTSTSSILQIKSKDSPNQGKDVAVEQLQGSEPTEADLTYSFQRDPLATTDVLDEMMHYLQQEALNHKTTSKSLNANTQELLNQIDKKLLMFPESKEMQKSTHSFSSCKVAASNEQECVLQDHFYVPRFKNENMHSIEDVISAGPNFETSFLQLPVAVPVLAKKGIHLCDSQVLRDSNCKTAIKAIESLPNDATKANTEHNVMEGCKSLDVSKILPCQLSPTLSSNHTTVASKSIDHLITPKCSSSVKPTKIVPASVFHADCLKCQCSDSVAKDLSNPEVCKSTFESHCMCSTVIQNQRTSSGQDRNDVHCGNSSYCMLEKYENSRTNPDLPLQSNALKSIKINTNDNKIMPVCESAILHPNINDQILQEMPVGVSASGATTDSLNNVTMKSVTFVSEMQSPLHDKSELTEDDTLQGFAINSDFNDLNNWHNLDTAGSADNPPDGEQWPVISSVFSLSCGLNDVPESIQWDNDQCINSTSFTTAQEILKTNPCPQIQANSKSLTLQFEKRHICEPSGHRNSVCLQASNDRNFCTVSSPSAVINGNSFQLFSCINMADHLSLLPPLTPSLPPMSPVENMDCSSANQFEQFVDDVHAFQNSRNLYSNEFYLNQPSLTSTSTSTAVEYSALVDSFVQRNSRDVPSTTGNTLTGSTQSCQTKPFSSPKHNHFPNLSLKDISLQSKLFENTLCSSIDGVDEPSISHNFSDTIFASTGITSNTCKQVSTVNQSPVALAEICKPNISSKGSSFNRNVSHSFTKVQEDMPTTSASSLKVCHQYNLQSKTSLFPLRTGTDPKNVNCTDAVENLKQIPSKVGKTMVLPEKVVLPSAATLQSVSLSTFVLDNQSNRSKVQLKPPNKTHSVLPPCSQQSTCYHKVAEDVPSQTEQAVSLVHLQNAAEIVKVVPNSSRANNSEGDSLGQGVQNAVLPELQSKSEMASSHLSAVLLNSSMSQVSPENTPPSQTIVKDPNYYKHETTYKIVSSDIVLRVLSAADNFKQKASTISCHSVNPSQNLGVLCPTTVSCSTAEKSELQASALTKKSPVYAELDSVNNCCSKIKWQVNSNCDQSRVSVRPNTFNTMSVKTAARQNSRSLKTSADEPLKHRNTRKKIPDHNQDEILLKKIKRPYTFVPVTTNQCEILKTARKLRLKPFHKSQLVKCPRRNQPVVVLNHPDVDVQEVANVMQTIGKYRGNVLKVVLSERTVISLNLKDRQRQEFENRGILLDKWHNCKTVSPVKERHMLKIKLKKIHKNNYQVVQNAQDEHLQFKFHCWFCGRMFCDQEEWIAHGQRHLMEATRDWNDVAALQEITEVLRGQKKSDV
ncbi:zinc finger protein 518A-like [Stegostoma tigrinum]|uniref:zinc finger protein 518A-like n=1 Tax=Stegostoma tigrinum TaxID=3053191 RepID=UPI00202B4846|nr:zinc finger protein 518A-like [Stegostoma tigrinum]XP_048391099.1 zinc finger protein 518A-like [Stegostoma tigrinum]XP_048391107.1 zinc finger protein 518A-like [Stegostoma tigrinum]